VLTESSPITGREDAGDRSRPVQALSEFYRAFNGRDLDLAAQNWETSDVAVMDNPLGGISRGWPAIRAVYEKLFTGPNRVQVEFWDYSIVETADCFIAIGRERGTLTAADGKTLDLRIRYSRDPWNEGLGCAVTAAGSLLPMPTRASRCVDLPRRQTRESAEHRRHRLAGTCLRQEVATAGVSR
jgi:ketosteroid isomerase-like protein